MQLSANYFAGFDWHLVGKKCFGKQTLSFGFNLLAEATRPSAVSREHQEMPNS
jgi:hypothetical protein